MEREVVWASWDGTTLEHLRLIADETGVVADGLVLGVEAGRPFRARYRVRCDTGWRVREVAVDPLRPDVPGLALRADGEGHWTTDAGEALSALDGCLDVDIRATPFTNTLPIRRLGLGAGQAREIAVVYVAVPGMEVTPVPQRYTCLEGRPNGGRYRYEGLSTGFAAELPVDPDGLVVDYPGVFRRVWP